MKLESVWGSKVDATETAVRLAAVFGGSNMVEGVGRWYDDEGRLWLEPSFTVTVYADDLPLTASTHASIVGAVLDAGTELSVLVVVDGRHEFMGRKDA